VSATTLMSGHDGLVDAIISIAGQPVSLTGRSFTRVACAA